MREASDRLWLLPDGQRVIILTQYGDRAVVQRVDGLRQGTRAICAVSKLRKVPKLAR
jgi:hypothetical protein